MSTQKQYAMNIELKNNALYKAMQKQGITTLKALAAKTGVPISVISKMSKMQIALLDKDGNVRDDYKKIADALQIAPTELVPAAFHKNAAPKKAPLLQLNNSGAQTWAKGNAREINEDDDIHATFTLQNFIILDAMRENGIYTQKELAAQTGISPRIISDMVNLKRPLYQKGEIDPAYEKVAKKLNLETDEIVPEGAKEQGLKNNKFVRSIADKDAEQQLKIIQPTRKKMDVDGDDITPQNNNADQNPTNEGDDPNQTNEGDDPNQTNEGDNQNQTNEGEDPTPTNEGDDPNQTNEGDDPNQTNEGDDPNQTNEVDDPNQTNEGEDKKPSRLKSVFNFVAKTAAIAAGSYLMGPFFGAAVGLGMTALTFFKDYEKSDRTLTYKDYYKQNAKKYNTRIAATTLGTALGFGLSEYFSIPAEVKEARDAIAPYSPINLQQPGELYTTPDKSPMDIIAEHIHEITPSNTQALDVDNQDALHNILNAASDTNTIQQTADNQDALNNIRNAASDTNTTQQTVDNQDALNNILNAASGADSQANVTTLESDQVQKLEQCTDTTNEESLALILNDDSTTEAIEVLTDNQANILTSTEQTKVEQTIVAEQTKVEQTIVKPTALEAANNNGTNNNLTQVYTTAIEPVIYTETGNAIILDNSVKDVDTARITIAANAFEQQGFNLSEDTLAYNAQKDVFYIKDSLELSEEQIKALKVAGINPTPFNLKRGHDGLILLQRIPNAA